MLENKQAFVAMTSGGTPIGGDIDFLTPWLKKFLKFLGITDVTMIGASGTRKSYVEESMIKAREEIDQLEPLQP